MEETFKVLSAWNYRATLLKRVKKNICDDWECVYCEGK